MYGRCECIPEFYTFIGITRWRLHQWQHVCCIRLIHIWSFLCGHHPAHEVALSLLVHCIQLHTKSTLHLVYKPRMQASQGCWVVCRLFEPYVIHVIGKLLNCYSDSARLVREGAHAAARAIMANLSGQGRAPIALLSAIMIVLTCVHTCNPSEPGLRGYQEFTLRSCDRSLSSVPSGYFWHVYIKLSTTCMCVSVLVHEQTGASAGMLSHVRWSIGTTVCMLASPLRLSIVRTGTSGSARTRICLL